jgi:hypothetical protein
MVPVPDLNIMLAAACGTLNTGVDAQDLECGLHRWAMCDSSADAYPGSWVCC